ncbi:hypothetical protein Tco_0017147 [Tanacetum coccineum]
MDDPKITIEEYIRLEEEKARKRGKVFNWETAKYGRIWNDEDVHDLITVENKFPDITFNDSLTSGETLSCEPTVSSLNDEIDFRISFDDSDDEDYNTVHIDEFDLNDETALSEYDEEEQNMLFYLIMNLYAPPGILFDPKRYYKDGVYTRTLQRPRYQGLEYTDAGIADFEERLGRIYSREIHWVQVVDFQGMPELMRDVLHARMLMEHRDDGGVILFTSQAWERVFETRGPLV